MSGVIGPSGRREEAGTEFKAEAVKDMLDATGPIGKSEGLASGGLAVGQTETSEGGPQREGIGSVTTDRRSTAR